MDQASFLANYSTAPPNFAQQQEAMRQRYIADAGMYGGIGNYGPQQGQQPQQQQGQHPQQQGGQQGQHQNMVQGMPPMGVGYLPGPGAPWQPAPGPWQPPPPMPGMHGGGGGGGPGGSGFVGWGGQAIHDNSGSRVPWFGRRQKNNNPGRGGQGRDNRQGGGPGGRGQGGWDQHHGPHGPAAGRGAHAEDSMSVEEMVAVLQKLGALDPIPESIFRALHHLDSRAVALLLKDLSRVGKDKRAMELFDWLRSLNERNPLRNLCDVYTYTAMISMCIYQQDVDRAMELVEDMRQRGIERNVHTYTALMNVCIKCGKLAMALDIYNSMKAMGCIPNVVTYNTLVDVYGKLGQWEKAVQVLDVMKHAGVEPVLRTYNTCLIACNMCNQPRDALAVYHRLLSDGYTPNSTTFNALISAYGKTGQLDKALEVYQEMLRLNMERSVITYSSLISACEKAGQWETALKIFNEMTKDGCAPNTVTYNSLITACSQGGQWEKANEVFEQMGSQGCAPDVVTYTALISAFERGGQWQKALQAFHKMCLQGCKPDAIVYNAIIDTLWETGIIWAQGKALQLFLTAVQQGQFRQEPIVRKPGRVELNLHAMTAGVAMLSLYCWLLEIKRVVTEKGPGHIPSVLAIVTDVGKVSREQGNCIVKEAVAAMMNFWEAPFRPVQDPTYAAVLEGNSAQVAEWVSSTSFTAQLASLFPISDSKQLADETYNAREAQVSQECMEAFTAVTHFENTHGLILSNMSAAYVQQRPILISRLLDLSSQFGLRDEVVHDAVLLMDRTASQAKQVPEDVLPLVGVAALVIAAKQGDATAEHVPTSTEIEQRTELPATAVAKMEWNIRGLLTDDISAISTMRCLKIYLERLGYRFLDKQDVYGMAGFAIMLAVESLYDLTLLNCRPSVVAAAILYAERRLRGAVPFWPSMLSKLTGYEDMATPELNVAVRIAQKLSRKLVYAQMYKAQLTQLAAQSGVPSGLSVTPVDLPSGAAAVVTAGIVGGVSAAVASPHAGQWQFEHLTPLSAAGLGAGASGAGGPSGSSAAQDAADSLDLLAQKMQALSTAGSTGAQVQAAMDAALSAQALALTQSAMKSAGQDAARGADN